MSARGTDHKRAQGDPGTRGPVDTTAIVLGRLEQEWQSYKTKDCKKTVIRFRARLSRWKDGGCGNSSQTLKRRVERIILCAHGGGCLAMFRKNKGLLTIN